MLIEMLKGKIHRATVTEANLDYIGSLTLDEDLMDAAGFKEFEKIQVLDITNGSRIETYLIKGDRSTGQVCINGAAAQFGYWITPSRDPHRHLGSFHNLAKPRDQHRRMYQEIFSLIRADLPVRSRR